MDLIQNPPPLKLLPSIKCPIFRMNKPFFAHACPRQIKNAFISITGMNAFLPHRFRRASVCYIEVGVLVGSQLVSHFLAVGLLKVLHHLGIDLFALGADDRSYHFAVCPVGMSAVIVEALRYSVFLGCFSPTSKLTSLMIWVQKPLLCRVSGTR